MAALTGEIIGGDLFLRLSSDGGTTHDIVGCIKGVELTFNAPTIDVSSQSSGGYKKKKPGRGKEITGSANGLMRFSDVSGEINANDIFTLADDGTFVPFLFQPETPATGDVTYGGTVLISNLSISAPNDAEATYSFNFESSGTVTVTVASV